MNRYNIPEFITLDDGSIKIIEGEFKNTIFKYEDVIIDDKSNLKYAEKISNFEFNNEDINETCTRYNHAKFLNTIATPILTMIVEDINDMR